MSPVRSFLADEAHRRILHIAIARSASERCYVATGIAVGACLLILGLAGAFLVTHTG